jgi:hypothetical protein
VSLRHPDSFGFSDPRDLDTSDDSDTSDQQSHPSAKSPNTDRSLSVTTDRRCPVKGIWGISQIDGRFDPRDLVTSDDSDTSDQQSHPSAGDLHRFESDMKVLTMKLETTDIKMKGGDGRLRGVDVRANGEWVAVVQRGDFAPPSHRSPPPKKQQPSGRRSHPFSPVRRTIQHQHRKSQSRTSLPQSSTGGSKSLRRLRFGIPRFGSLRKTSLSLLPTTLRLANRMRGSSLNKVTYSTISSLVMPFRMFGQPTTRLWSRIMTRQTTVHQQSRESQSLIPAVNLNLGVIPFVRTFRSTKPAAHV